MDDYLTITQINDFIFCPRSILFHNFLTENYTPDGFREAPQITGLAAHKAVDSGAYSSRKDVLQGTMVYCSRYRLLGRIDTFDISSGKLCERKYSITAVYPGFRYQLYAQFYALTEMGFLVKEMLLYSSKDNQRYPIPIPTEKERKELENILLKIRNYSPDSPLQINLNKCRNCNYREICDLFPENERS